MFSVQSTMDWKMMKYQPWEHDSQSQRNQIDDEYTMWTFLACNYWQKRKAIDFGSMGTC